MENELEEKIITVFGSSRPREGEADYEEARRFRRALAEGGFAVCSGGYGGAMAGSFARGEKSRRKNYGVTAEFFSAQSQCVDRCRSSSW